MINIGEKIKKLRKEKRLTQEELGKIIGVATGTMQNYELDKRKPNYETLNKISKVLEVSIDELINDSIDIVNVGENIRIARKIKNITMKQLGENLGITEQAISQYERGVRTPNTKLILKISSILEVNPTDIDPELKIFNTSDGMLGSSLGEKIKFYRSKANLTQNDLSDKAEISLRALSNYEKGSRVPPMEVTIKIANALGVKSTQLDPDIKIDITTISTEDLILELLRRTKECEL